MDDASIDARQELQRRIGNFAQAAFVIAGGMLIASLLVDALVAGSLPPSALRGSRMAHMAAQVVLLVGWLRCRGAPLSARALEAIDAALTIVTCIAWAMLGVASPARSRSRSPSPSPAPTPSCRARSWCRARSGERFGLALSPRCR